MVSSKNLVGSCREGKLSVSTSNFSIRSSENGENLYATGTTPLATNRHVRLTKQMARSFCLSFHLLHLYIRFLLVDSWSAQIAEQQIGAGSFNIFELAKLSALSKQLALSFALRLRTDLILSIAFE